MIRSKKNKFQILWCYRLTVENGQKRFAFWCPVPIDRVGTLDNHRPIIHRPQQIRTIKICFDRRRFSTARFRRSPVSIRFLLQYSITKTKHTLLISIRLVFDGRTVDDLGSADTKRAKPLRAARCSSEWFRDN